MPVILKNKELEICVEVKGGVISSLQHITSPVNPLSFHMARGNGGDQYFSGHFICAPRWGDASDGEAKSGAIKHGELCHLPWEIEDGADHFARASVSSARDQIKVEREMQLSTGSPVCKVTETITNTGRLLRPCNLVQHPTIAAPFLHEQTRIDCNAGAGVRDTGVGNVPLPSGSWPSSLNAQGSLVELYHASVDNAGVYSFEINSETGWITAFDPHSGLLLGYCWDAWQFPWVHHWIHTENNKPVYRGLEFGTAALHQPFDVIAKNNWWQYHDKPSCFFLDAGSSRTFTYHFFLTPLPAGFEKVNNVFKKNDTIVVEGHGKRIPLIL